MHDVSKTNSEGEIFMEQKDTLGKFITKKRKELNLTQKDLAEKLFVTESAVSKWERGISYPDITLISDLCSTLQISEHELVTASEDLRQRAVEKQAKKLRIMKKTTQWIFNLSYITAIVTCFICNLAVNHKLSWFFIVLTSIALAFSITTMPALIPKHKGCATLGAFLLTLGLLLMTCCIYTGGDWFFISYMPVLFSAVIIFLPIVLTRLDLPSPLCNQKTLITFIVDTFMIFLLVGGCLKHNGKFADFYPKAVPIILISIAYAWAIMIIIRYVRVNKLFKTAICMIISAVEITIINPLLNIILLNEPFKLLKFNLNKFSSQEYINGNINLIVVISFFLLAVLFTMGGILLTVKRDQLMKANK